MRRYVYSDLPNDPASLSTKQWEVVGDLATLFDRIGTFIEGGVVPEHDLLRSHGFAIAKLWLFLEPYIEVQRRDPGRRRYVPAFQRLAQRALDDLDADELPSTRGVVDEPWQASDRSGHRHQPHQIAQLTRNGPRRWGAEGRCWAAVPVRPGLGDVPAGSVDPGVGG